jgi:hypothetical protein
VSRLVLVSPVGIPCAPEERPEESPFDASKRRRTDSQSGGPVDAEVLQPQSSITAGETTMERDARQMAAQAEGKEEEVQQGSRKNNAPPPRFGKRTRELRRRGMSVG